MSTEATGETPGKKSSAGVVIQRGSQGFFSTLAEAWRYRELFSFLAWRDISVRYKQTVFGILWIIIQPLVSTVLFVVIRLMLKREAEHHVIQDFIIVLGSMVPWMFCANLLRRASGSLVGNSALITKVYFPRIIIPWASSLSVMVDYAIGMVMVGAFIIYGALSPAVHLNTGLPILALPLLSLLALAMTVSVGLFFAAVNVRFRDVGFVLGYIIQMGMHASAVWWTMGEAVSKFPAYGKYIMINPVVGLMEGFRWSLMGSEFPAVPLLISCGFTLVAFIVGYKYFLSVERTFADVI